jgi:predicted ArsR family transcriptional regulator
MPELTPTLRAVAEYGDQARHVDQKLRALVAQARSEGASWEQIGQALGITKQAAQQRFGKTAKTD